METVLEGLVVIGGLTFSLATALLVEELIFARIFRVVFAHRAEVTMKQTRLQQGTTYRR